MPKHSRLTWSATTIQRLPTILFACLLKSLSLVWHGLCWSRRPRNDNFIGTAIIIYGRPIPPTLLSVQLRSVQLYPRHGGDPSGLAKKRLLCSAWCWNDRDLHIPIQRLIEWVPGTWYCPRWLFRVRPYILHGGRVLIRSQFVISCRLVSPINPPEPTTGNWLVDGADEWPL